MSRKMDLPRVAASALAMGMATGLATVAQAQVFTLPEPIQCQYWTGQSDPLTLLNEVTEPFDIEVVAVQENKNQTKLVKGTGQATAVFEESDAVNEGSFEAEVDAKLKATEDEPDLVCAESAKVRGLGILDVDTDEEDGVRWLIRDGSKLDGNKRSGTLAECQFNEGACSVHKVKATLRITTQGERGNGSAKYEKFTLNQKDIFEAYEGVPPTKGQDLVLLCGCLTPEVPENDGGPGGGGGPSGPGPGQTNSEQTNGGQTNSEQTNRRQTVQRRTN